MTPQEAKAKELVNCMNDKIISFENVRLRGEGFEMSKQCALIAVDFARDYAYLKETVDELKEIKEAINKL